MFRKIVSNLPFSPALIGQLGFYARRLRQEEITRRAGLILTVFALLAQSFAVFRPPQAANASSPADFVPGGITSINEYVGYYDRNYNNIHALFDSLGITRSELLNANKIVTIDESSRYNWAMTSLYSYAQGERPYTFKISGGTKTVYYRPMRLTQTGGDLHRVYQGYSKIQGWFAIKIDCGNLITETPPKPLPPPPAPAPQPTAICKNVGVEIADRTLVSLRGEASTSGGATVSKYTFTIRDGSGKTVKTISLASSQLAVVAPSFVFDVPGKYTVQLTVTTSLGDRTNLADCAKSFTIVQPAQCPVNATLTAENPDCQPCPGDSTLWIKDTTCTAVIIATKDAQNTTIGKTASSVKARPADKISYTLSIENKGLIATTASIKENLSDVLEYATLTELGGGNFEQQNKALMWADIQLGPGEKQSRTFTVKLLDRIPATNTGTSNQDSYNCIMTNTFGNSIDIAVECPVQKAVVEQVVKELPKTGPGENMLFAGIVLAVVTYFYARSRQLGKEVRLVRRNAHAGML